ncbi:LysM peptidoglycan-binding domain-containing protein [Arthrobacter sp. R-11]|uniref:LysM peptidoglycan-binding domain-containing protein n=1 Tax=Arthrobacter sp. R-11 TaxID=3404053 RepID=UPI003CF2487D
MNETERPLRHDAAMAVVILLLGFLLLGLGCLLLERWKIASTHNQGLMFGDIIGFAATGVGMLIVVWWLLSLLLAFASAICQKAGRTTGATVAGRFSPLFMRRLAMAVLGLNLLGAPLAQASPSLVEAAWTPPSGSTIIPAAWTPLSHTTDAAAVRKPSTAEPGSVAEIRNTSPGRGSAVDIVEPQWQPRPPVAEPGLVGPRITRAAQQADSPSAKEVVVLRGDSLWSIAARDLGPMASDVEIARHWPKWYAANKEAIGDDPGLIVPGQILQAPPKN